MMPVVSPTKCCKSRCFAIEVGALQKDLQSKLYEYINFQKNIICVEYHLYFIPLILQLNLLFPVIFWLCKRIRIKTDTVRGFAVTCTVLYCFQWCLEYFYTKYISASFSNWANIVISYVLVIGIGVWCGANYGRMRACAEKWYWIALVWGVIGFVFIHNALYPEEPFLPVWVSGSAIWVRMMFLTYGSVSSLLLTFLAIRISDKLDWLGRI